MKIIYILPVIALISFTMASCNGNKKTSPQDEEIVIEDSICQMGGDDAHVAEVRNRENHTVSAPIAIAEEPIKAQLPQEPIAQAVIPQESRTEPNNNSSTANSTSSNDAEIMLQIRRLDERTNELLAKLEVLRSRLQQAKDQGIQVNTNSEFDLHNVLNELIDIKNEQIGLAKRLGNEMLERGYVNELEKMQQTKDQILNDPK